MNRTYNFQVDNGIFVVEYLLDKDYKDITISDLRKNIDKFGDRIDEYKANSNIVSMTHQNSYMTQKGKDIRDQMNFLLDNIGEDKTCMICGEKRVNVTADIPYTALIYGAASPDNFMNRGNNLRTVDICPVCLFFSILSFLNTQKMGWAILYNSNSDEFMRNITKTIQIEINKKILLEFKNSKDMDKKFIETMTKLKIDEKNYDDLDYIELVRFNNNPQNPRIEKLEISDEKLSLINRIKNRGLIQEFFNKNLFYKIVKGLNPIKTLSRYRNSSVETYELYEILKEVYMTEKEIQLVEDVANKLIEVNGEKALVDLKLIKGKVDFKEFLIKYSEKIQLCRNLSDYNKMIENHYDYKDYLILELNSKMKGDR